MKKLFVIFTIWSTSMSALTGPQPLFIANITITPVACPPAVGSTIVKVTASGGQPAPDGSYTYEVIEPISFTPSQTMVGKTATFKVPGTQSSLLVSDSNNVSVLATIVYPPSASTSISMNIDSLALGAGNGCITFSVTNPAGKETGTVDFAIVSANNEPILNGKSTIEQTVKESPFTVIFPSLSSPFLDASVVTHNDCTVANNAFNFSFPFPQGMGNALKTYIFNKYCSCPLSKAAILS